MGRRENRLLTHGPASKIGGRNEETKEEVRKTNYRTITIDLNHPETLEVLGTFGAMDRCPTPWHYKDGVIDKLSDMGVVEERGGLLFLLDNSADNWRLNNPDGSEEEYLEYLGLQGVPKGEFDVWSIKRVERVGDEDDWCITTLDGAVYQFTPTNIQRMD